LKLFTENYLAVGSPYVAGAATQPNRSIPTRPWTSVNADSRNASTEASGLVEFLQGDYRSWSIKSNILPRGLVRVKSTASNSNLGLRGIHVADDRVIVGDYGRSYDSKNDRTF